MTLAHYMAGQFTLDQNIDFIIRIVAACLCGAAIGFERSMRFKEAGIRTHIIVCCAASLMMIISKYGFVDMVDESGNLYAGIKAADAARIAAQVVSGVSFLGAGIIFRNGTSIRGLTTAAGIWATAGIGLAIGAGMYLLGLVTTILIASIQILMHKYTMTADSMILGQVHCTVEHSDTFRENLNDFIEKNKIQVVMSRISINDDGSFTYDLTLRMVNTITLSTLSSFLESNEGVREVRCELGK